MFREFSTVCTKSLWRSEKWCGTCKVTSDFVSFLSCNFIFREDRKTVSKILIQRKKVSPPKFKFVSGIRLNVTKKIKNRPWADLSFLSWSFQQKKVGAKFWIYFFFCLFKLLFFVYRTKSIFLPSWSSHLNLVFACLLCLKNEYQSTANRMYLLLG